MTGDEKRRLLEQFGSCLPEVNGSLRKNAILKVLRKFDEPLSFREIVELTQLSYHSANEAAYHLVREGLIRRVVRGMYIANE